MNAAPSDPTDVPEADPSARTLIRNARLLDRNGLWDIGVTDGRINTIEQASAATVDEGIDADGGLVTPSFVESHFHPDKALTFPRADPILEISLESALRRSAAVKERFTPDDVAARAERTFELAVSHGIGTLRAQVDIDTVGGLTGFEGVLRAREQFAGRLDVQVAAFPQEGIIRDPGVVELLREALRQGADLLGGGPNNESSAEDHLDHLTTLFGLAAEFDVDLDLHVDFLEDPNERALELVAEQTIAHGYEGRVNASHCSALGVYDDEYAARVIELVRRAEMQICICPVVDLLLPTMTRTPRGRGASRPKELLDAGINVSAGTDNLHDAWFRFGRLDPVELGLFTCLVAGMATDAEVRAGFDMVTTRAAQYVGAPHPGVAVGAPADLVVFSATSIEDVLRQAEGRRTTIKNGRVVGGTETRTWLVEPTDIGSPARRVETLEGRR